VVQSGSQAILQIGGRDQKIEVPAIMLALLETLMQLRDELAARVAQAGRAPPRLRFARCHELSAGYDHTCAATHDAPTSTISCRGRILLGQRGNYASF